MFELNLGTVPEWFAGASLLLAFWIFANDRRNRTHAQVDQVGVWYENPSLTPRAELPAATYTAAMEIVARNSSLLPVTIRIVQYSLSIWYGLGEERVSRHLIPLAVLAPEGGEWRETVQHEIDLPIPGEGARVTCRIDEVRITDNAGRKWVVTRSGGTRRAGAQSVFHVWAGWLRRMTRRPNGGERRPVEARGSRRVP